MEKSGTRETGSLFAVLIISTVTTGAISGFVYNSGTAAYINAFLTAIAAFVLVGILHLCLGKDDFCSALGSVYGKTLSKLVMGIIFILTVASASVRMDMFADAIGKYVLTETPRIVIFSVIALCSFFAAFFGIEAITRYALVSFIVFVAFLGVIFFSSASEVRYINICPVLGKGDFISVASMLYVFSDIMYLYLISNRVKRGRSGVRAVFLGGTLTVLITLFYVLCVPYPVSQSYDFPLYTLASLSNSSVIFQRMDGLVFVIWIFTSFISVGALSFFATDIFARVFGISDRRAIVSAVTFIIFLVSCGGMLKADVILTISAALCFGFVPFTALICKLKKSWGRNR